MMNENLILIEKTQLTNLFSVQVSVNSHYAATWFEVGDLFEHSQNGFPNIDMTIRRVEAVPVVVQPDQQSNSSCSWLREWMRE